MAWERWAHRLLRLNRLLRLSLPQSRLCSHPSAGVRRNAIQVLPVEPVSAQAIVKAGLLQDSDAQVRLAAFLGLADQPATDEAAKAVVAALRGGAVAGDVWLPEAATAAAARNDEAFLKSLAAHGEKPAGPELIAIATRVAEHWARGGPVDGAQGLLASMAGGDQAADRSDHPRTGPRLAQGQARAAGQGG